VFCANASKNVWKKIVCKKPVEFYIIDVSIIFMHSKGEINRTNFKQYLLGNLSPPESEAIDLQIISDEDSEEKLLWAESELMEDYLDETLSPNEIELFKSNFLVSSERISQFKQISLMRNYARRAATKTVSENACETAPEGFFEKLKKFFSHNWRPLTAVSALVIVGIFAAFYLTANNQTASEIEYAALNQKDLSDLEEFKPLTNLSLTSGVFRDSGDARKLAENKLTEKVLFRLALPVQSNAPDKFAAELVKDGRTVFTLNNLPFYNNPNGQELRLLLPSAELKKGNYQLKLTKQSAPESPFVYNFTVE
jgi:hypothetical protein